MICRLAGDASFAPPAGVDENGVEIESTMSLAARKAQPLGEKLRNCLPTMMKNVCDRKFLAKWEAPVLDPKRDLFPLADGKFF